MGVMRQKWLFLPPTIVPAPHAALEDGNLPGEDSVTLLLQEQVMGVLQKDLGVAHLVVRPTQHLLADLGCGCPTVHLEVKTLSLYSSPTQINFSLLHVDQVFIKTHSVK